MSVRLITEANMHITQMITFLPCQDIRKTTQFYHDLLGLSISGEQAEGRLKIFSGQWGFCAYEDERSPLSGEKGVCLSLAVRTKEEVDQMYGYLKTKKCRFLHEPLQNTTFPVYSFIVFDPDDYKVEIQTFL